MQQHDIAIYGHEVDMMVIRQNKIHGHRHHRSKDIKRATWHRKVTDLVKNREG